MKKYTFMKALALVVYGTTAHSMFASTLSSPVDDEAFSKKQQEAMSKLATPVPQQEKATFAQEKQVDPTISVGKGIGKMGNNRASCKKDLEKVLCRVN